MEIPIHFDDQFRFRTVEIHDETSNGMLAAEFMPAQIAPAQRAPEGFFGRDEGFILARVTLHQSCETCPISP
jgi:hypothetical protein